MSKSATAPKQYDALKDGVPRRPIGLFVIGGILAVALVAGIIVAATAGGDDDSETNAVAFAAVDISGQSLEPFPADAQGIADPTSDPGIGQTVPTVEGETFTGESITAGPNGSPQIIVFLAHWCPHCQAEVPKLVEWMESGAIPESIGVQAISTGVDQSRGNYPPASWLERENWPDPVLADDSSGSASAAYGLSGFPYFVAVDGDGTVVMRGSGELTDGDMSQIVTALDTPA